MAPLLHPWILLTLVVTLWCALPAHAAMFKWVDESGSVTYSNTPPQDPDKVTDLVRIEEPAPPKQVEPAVAFPQPVTAKSEPAAPRADMAKRETEVAKPETPPRAVAAEAVQDPCLRSPDPQCYQRNKENYHPYRGYAPGASRAASAPAVGASGSAPAGGAIGGAVKTK